MVGVVVVVYKGREFEGCRLFAWPVATIVVLHRVCSLVWFGLVSLVSYNCAFWLQLGP